MKLGEMEVTLRMSSLAVELVEEYFGRDIDEIFAEGAKFKAKEINYMLWAMADTEMNEMEFKKALSKEYTYNETIGFLTNAVAPDPNEVAAVATESKPSKTPQK